MSHRNAPLTPEGRRRLCERVEQGRAICHVAAEAGIARQTLGKWYSRWQLEGEAGLQDRTSRPESSPQQTAPEVEARVVALRREHKVGPVQLIAFLAEEGLTVPASTIYRILVRHGLSRLRDLDVDGQDLREPVRRYEWDRPGDLIHVDVKKIGRIPDGGGWAVHGRGSAQHKATGRAKTAGARAGYVYLHSAVDDHSRLAYTEELPDEKGATAAGFWQRAVKFFKRHGIKRIRRVLTDNGSCYRSIVFAAALAASRTRHKRTRPYHPQTNGKVERYQRTLSREWARSRAWNSNAERAAALPGLPRSVQLPSTPHRTERQTPRQPRPHRCHQPRGVEQLINAAGSSFGRSVWRPMGDRLRVLYLTHHGPWPASSGGRLRDAALIPHLARLADLEVWAVSRSPESDRAAFATHSPGIPYRIYADEGVRRDYPTRSSEQARQDLSRRLAGPVPFDVIHVEGGYLFHLVPEAWRHRAVVVEHNIESHLLEQRGRVQGFSLAHVADVSACAFAEEEVWREAAVIVTLSEEDQARVAARVPSARVRVSTNGADHVGRPGPIAAASCSRSDKPTIGFLANYLYPPNQDALKWLTEEIFPGIRHRVAGSRLLLAGSNLDVALAARRLPDGVLPHGWFEDLGHFWRAADVVVCPLRIGGGVKVKMIEALANGSFTVSTAIGVEGLPPSAQRAVLRADTTDGFVAGIERLLIDEDLRMVTRHRLERVRGDLSTWSAVAGSMFQLWLSVSRPIFGGVCGR